jgi:hypothetical protein
MVSINGMREDQPVNDYVSESPDNINNIDEGRNIASDAEGINGVEGQQNNRTTQTDAGRRKKIVVVGLGMVAISFMYATAVILS